MWTDRDFFYIISLICLIFHGNMITMSCVNISKGVFMCPYARGYDGGARSCHGEPVEVRGQMWSRFSPSTQDPQTELAAKCDRCGPCTLSRLLNPSSQGFEGLL